MFPTLKIKHSNKNIPTHQMMFSQVPTDEQLKEVLSHYRLDELAAVYLIEPGKIPIKLELEDYA